MALAPTRLGSPVGWPAIGTRDLTITGTGSLVTGYNSAQCVRFDSAVSERAHSISSWGGSVIPANDLNSVGGFGADIVGYPTSACSLFTFTNSAQSDGVEGVLGTDGTLSLYLWTGSARSTLLGSSSAGAIPTGARFCLTLHVFLDDASGTAQVWVNGASVLTVSATDTRGSTVAGLVSLQVYNVVHSTLTTRTNTVDHLWVGRGTAADMDASSYRIDVLRPNGGTGFGSVDEDPANSTDSVTVNNALGSGFIWDLTDPAAISGSAVRAVQGKYWMDESASDFTRKFTTRFNPGDGSGEVQSANFGCGSGSSGNPVWTTAPAIVPASAAADPASFQSGIIVDVAGTANNALYYHSLMVLRTETGVLASDTGAPMMMAA
jgi:hypothetical protein